MTVAISSTPIYPPTRPSIFGPIVTGHDVEQWCLALLKRWTGTYLAEVERQAGLVAGDLARPRAYVITPTLDRWPEDQLPAVLLVSPGLAERPVKDGGGYYRARWEMAAACHVSARTELEAHAMAQRYTAALMRLFIQRPSLDGKANGVDWLEESYDQLDHDSTRSLAVGFARFTVQADNIALANAGPATPSDPLDPDTQPWPDWPLVETVDVDVENVDQITPEGGAS